MEQLMICENEYNANNLLEKMYSYGFNTNYEANLQTITPK